MTCFNSEANAGGRWQPYLKQAQLIALVMLIKFTTVIDSAKIRSWHDAIGFLDGTSPKPVENHGFTESDGLLFKFGGYSIGLFTSFC